MDKLRWQEIEEIVDNALKLQTKQEKKLYVERACKNDEQLHQQVIKLLEAITQADENNFLEL
ncbi:hypothetical protein NC796_18885 [Aliifodinibius sp. S!AR15-10]|uniref:hypothetical protein n=1 Tax=Aliifodinibius sp. S!AR15-10 TaxID=2950437 RepID=UPI00285CA18D|nr:hypothetical protein [Aliifodinibius sp. S!AR15-10]MDR8393228.1 hypothetical protein [Aliifodinibius sp. S!AR15-10]